MANATRPGTAPPATTGRSALAAALLSIALITGFAVLLLKAEAELAIGALLVGAAGLVFAAARVGALRAVGSGFQSHEGMASAAAVVAVLVLAAIFREDHFTLLMIATVLLYMLACVGLTIQFGFIGVINLCGASFLGIGAYTAAVLLQHTSLPPLAVLAIGGLMAALFGSVLVLPMLRTRGHYTAVVTIAFAILFVSFLQVNDTLGGPQGLSVEPMKLFGFDFAQGIEMANGFATSFYMNYLLLALLLLVIAFTLLRRIERSWLGLSFDAVRLDETAAETFGISLARAKFLGFTLGNFLIGVAGALYATMLGYIAPANFTFSDSLILVSIVLLGGTGNPWGLAVAASIVVVLPEKLQVIQEYRFLLFACLVIVILLFRPDGLIPRGQRNYLPHWRSKP